ncbi:MAG: hypothetical protein ACK583_08275 [Cyanobacteriota bacterium]
MTWWLARRPNPETLAPLFPSDSLGQDAFAQARKRCMVNLAKRPGCTVE